MNGEPRIAILFSSEPIAVGEPGKRQKVLLIRDGETVLRDGGKIMLDAEGARSVIEAFNASPLDLPFDRNHSTVLKAGKGEDAPAVGWIKGFSYERGTGLFAEVEWTPEGHEDIKSKKYRYPSPVILFEPDTGRVRRIHSAAVTNTPAQPDIPALAASHVLFKEKIVMNEIVKKLLQDEGSVATAEQKVGELKALLESMGVELGDGADFVAIINAAIAKLKGEGGEKKEDSEASPEEAAVAASVRVTLGLVADADRETVTKALADLKGHVGYVPATEHTKMLARVDALENDRAQRNAEDLVQACLSQGKLLANDEEQMKWARDRAKNAPEDFKQLMAHAPVIAPQGRTTPPDVPAPGTSPGGSEDKLIEKALSDHQGNHKNAMIALQTDLLREHTSRGLTQKAALANCERQYPKIFGAAA